MDSKPDSIQQLRSVSELVRARFESDQDSDTLREVVEDGPIAYQMREAIADTLAQVRSLYLVDIKPGNTSTTVVHYTRIEVVVDMLMACIEEKPSYLRLYDTFHSNDPDEGKYLTRYLDPAIRDGLMEGPGNSTCAYVTSFIRPESESQGDIRNVMDNLVFWRTYGDDGAGCSLTVRVCLIIRFMSPAALA